MSNAVICIIASICLCTVASPAAAAQPSPSADLATVDSPSEAVPEKVDLPNNWYEELSRPKEGYVPNAETAIAIAKAVWLPIYGSAVLRQLPIKAVLNADEWLVSGTFQGKGFGGSAMARISKKSGCVLEVSHGE